MNVNGFWDAALIVLVILAAGWAIYERSKKGETITVPTITGELQSAVPLAVELREAAQLVVNDIEQLRRGATTIPNDEAFKLALTHLKEWFPGLLDDVTDEQAAAAINGAVLVASQISHSIEAAKNGQLESLLTDGAKTNNP